MSIQILLVLTVLSLAPAILIMTTSFTRIVIILSFLRQGLGTQQVPPNQVLIGLALFLTFFTMQPTFEQIDQQALTPYLAGKLGTADAFKKAEEPLRQFMFKQVREKDLALFVALVKVEPSPYAFRYIDVGPYSGLRYWRIKKIIRNGFYYFCPFFNYRYGGGFRVDVDGYDDAPPCSDFATL